MISVHILSVSSLLTSRPLTVTPERLFLQNNEVHSATLGVFRYPDEFKDYPPIRFSFVPNFFTWRILVYGVFIQVGEGSSSRLVCGVFIQVGEGVFIQVGEGSSFRLVKGDPLPLTVCKKTGPVTFYLPLPKGHKNMFTDTLAKHQNCHNNTPLRQVQ